jgi:choloylglycine hydrolase
MLRQAGIATLIAAFIIATTPIYACTGISLKAADGTAIRGRTMEFGVPMDSNVIVIPKGMAMAGTLPDGSKGIGYTTKYAMVGANGAGLPIVVDGINDQGLSFGAFYFPGFVGYATATADNSARAIAPIEFGNWVLGSFATVDEVKAGLNGIAIVPTKAPGLNIAPPLHYFVSDKSGKSIVIEPVDGVLKVYDDPLGVVTNSPGFDWHMTNLRNYVNLTVTGVPPVDLDGVQLAELGQGAGMHGLPGDFTPPSRFVRAVAFSQAALPSATGEDAVLAAFHILNQFDIPYGAVRDSKTPDASVELTQWTTVSDTKSGRWYYRTYGDQSIHMVDLRKAVDAAKGQIRTIKMGSKQPIDDDSTTFIDGDKAAQ